LYNSRYRRAVDEEERRLDRILPEQLVTRLDTIQEMVSVVPDMNSRLRRVASDVAAIKAEQDVHRMILKEHSSELKEIRSDVSEIRSDVGELKADVGELKLSVNQLQLASHSLTS
jgi:chromosome segregation ATPase